MSSFWWRGGTIGSKRWRTRSRRPAGRGRWCSRSISNSATPSQHSPRNCRRAGLSPQFVVNNAGFGLSGAAAALSRDEQLGMIDLNVRALTELSLTFVDSLARHRGGILNVASIAAFLPGPGMAVYYASKAYVLSFTEALHRELARSRHQRDRALSGSGRDRIPGTLGHGAAERRQNHRAAARPRAAIGYDALMRGQRVVIAGTGNKMAVAVMRFVPNALLLRRSTGSAR